MKVYREILVPEELEAWLGRLVWKESRVYQGEMAREEHQVLLVQKENQDCRVYLAFPETKENEVLKAQQGAKEIADLMEWLGTTDLQAYLVFLVKWVLEAFLDHEGFLDFQGLQEFLVLKVTKKQKEMKVLLGLVGHQDKLAATGPLDLQDLQDLWGHQDRLVQEENQGYQVFQVLMG